LEDGMEVYLEIVSKISAISKIMEFSKDLLLLFLMSKLFLVRYLSVLLVPRHSLSFLSSLQELHGMSLIVKAFLQVLQ